jgi:5-formyltetrahydrofolate cyclo-ligase
MFFLGASEAFASGPPLGLVVISDLGGVNLKAVVRKGLRDRLRAFALDSGLKLAAEGRLAGNLSALFSGKSDLTIAAFYPLSEEPDLSSFYSSLSPSLSLVFPKLLPGFDQQDMQMVSVASFSSEAWEVTPLGFRQPSSERVVPVESVDVILVPGLGFSSVGERLGRGKGFYDRYLAGFTGLKVGVCFDCQFTQQALPTDSWDIKMNFIITESKCLEIKE